MSIEAHLLSLEDEKKILRFQAPEPLASKRAMFITSELAKELGPTSAAAFHGAIPEIRRMMERWVSGQTMTVKIGGRSGRPMLRRLDPPPADVWELRIVEPNPQFRMFCCFPAADTLIATSLRNRNELGDWFRGRKRGQLWESAMYGCRSIATALLQPYPIFAGASEVEYVTENCDVV